MKNILLLFTLLFPLLIFADYNGVHIAFDIQLNNGNAIHGYKYVAFGENTEAYKKNLEDHPEIFLQNQYTNEIGAYGYYQKRLKYAYRKSYVYSLIEPAEIKLNEIESVNIKEMIMASYAIQLAGDYQWSDRLWMNTEAISHFSEDEGMCTYDIFIHKNGAVPNKVIQQLKVIIKQIDHKIAVRAAEFEINDDLAYQERMKDLYEERNRLLKPIFEQYKNLKIVTISMCTC